MCTNVTAVAAAPLTIALDCEDVAAAVEDVAQGVQQEASNEEALLLQLKNTKRKAALPANDSTSLGDKLWTINDYYYGKRKKREQ